MGNKQSGNDIGRPYFRDASKFETLDSIEKAKIMARKEHEMRMIKSKKLAEYNRLVAEKDKIYDLVKSQSSEISLLNYEVDLKRLDMCIKSEQNKSKLYEAQYKLEIELPAELEIYKVKRFTSAKISKIGAELRANIYAYREIELAKLHLKTSESLSEINGSKQVAQALSHYYKALIIDQIACRILKVLATRLMVDPSFRFKLERPLTLRKQHAVYHRIEAIDRNFKTHLQSGSDISKVNSKLLRSKAVRE